MAKSNSPFFSFGAQGSVADAITARHSRGVDVLEKKPVPTDPKSLPQIYQRWDYQDYISQWHALSSAEKRTWHSNASRFHMTGFAYWMRYNLKNLPDLTARYHLDERSGALAQDFSKNENHATVIGALPTVGHIDYGLEFDGVNDLCSAPHITAYNLTDNFSLQAWVYPVTQTLGGVAWRVILSRDSVFWLSINRTNHRIRFYWYPAGVPTTITSPAAIPLDQGTLLTVTFESTTFVRMYFGTTVIASAATPLPTQTQIESFCIGNAPALNRPYKGIIDHAILYDGVLTPLDIARQNERRYP